MNIEKLDKNFEIKTTVEETDVRWHNVTEQEFDIYGLYEPKNGESMRRMPKDAAAAVSSSVEALCQYPAGGRIRFRTDSPYIAIRVFYDKLARYSHMPFSGNAGFDLYCYEGGEYHYVKNAMPISDDKNGYERIFFKTNSGMHDFLIHMPPYNNVSAVYIGLKEGSRLEHGSQYRDVKPVLYYGSSITQGGCASRPGNGYTNMISMMLDIDHINLGFSGNAKGELAMADYIGGLDLSVFVLDYDHNAPNVEHLKNTHEAFFKRYRIHQPNTPVIMVSRPDVNNDKKWELRAEIIKTTYENAIAAGDKNVMFINGKTLFEGDMRDSCTVDGCHPNDLGFYRMAKVIGAAVAKYL